MEGGARKQKYVSRDRPRTFSIFQVDRLFDLKMPFCGLKYTEIHRLAGVVKDMVNS